MTLMLPGIAAALSPTSFYTSPLSTPTTTFRPPATTIPTRKPKRPRLVTLTEQEFRHTQAGRQPGATYQGYLRYIAQRRKPAAAPIAGRSSAPGGLATLTADQFYRTPAGQQKGASYAKYLSYLAKHRVPRAPAPAANTNPLAPSDTPSFGDLLSQASAFFGKPLSEAEIAAEAQKTIQDQIDPYRQNLEAESAARLKTSLELIRQYTQAYVNQVSGMPAAVAAEYGAARDLTNRQDSALTGFLQSHGQEQGSQLASELSAINAPQASQDLAAAASSGTGNQSADVNAAASNATADRLAAEGGAQGAYASALPGLAALSGLQQTRNITGQIESDLQRNIADLNARVPGLIDSLVTSLRSSNASQRNDAIQIAASLFNSAQGRETQKAIAAAGFGIDTQKIASQNKRSAATIAAQGARSTAANATRLAIATANRNASTARAAADRASRETIASIHATAAQKAAARKQLASSTAASTKAVASSFQRAAAAAAKMHAGTYGQAGQSSGGDPFTSSTAGPPTPFWRAYNSIHSLLQGQLGQRVTPAGLRALTLQALKAGGYVFRTRNGRIVFGGV